MALTAAELQVIIGADIGDSLARIGKVERALAGVHREASKGPGIFGRLGGALGSVATQAAGVATGLFAFQGISGVMHTVTDSVIGMNAQLETTGLQFETLMGSADEARKHVASLFEFAKKTPFETGPVIQASKYLRTFGGAALDTEKNLTLVGDASAATGTDIGQLSFWVGRLYSGLQAGQPIGEAMQRLTELAVISPKARAQIMKLSGSAKNSKKIWEIFSKDIARFSGGMEKQAESWQGLTSTLSDAISLTLAKLGEPIFQAAKGGIKKLVDWLSDPAVQAGIEGFGKAIVDGLGKAGDVLGTLAKMAAPVVGFISSLFGGGSKLRGDELEGMIKGLGPALERGLKDLLGTFGVWLDKSVLPWLRDNLPAMASTLLGGLVELVKTLWESVADFEANVMFPWLQENLPKILSTIVGWISDHAGDIGDALVKWGREFVAWAAKIAPPLLDKLGKLLWTLGKWVVTEGLPKLVDAGVKFAGSLISGFMDSLTGSGGQGKGILATVGEWVANTLVPGLIDLGGQLLRAGADWAASLGRGFADTLIRWIESALNGVIRALNSFRVDLPGIDLGPLGKVGEVHWRGFGIPLVHLAAPRPTTGSRTGGMRAFASGAWEIPRTMLGILHQGEMVVPRAPAEAFRRGLAGTEVRVTVNIENFGGQPADISELSRALGREVRAALVASYSAGRMATV